MIVPNPYRENPYQMYELGPDASPDQIRSAYPDARRKHGAIEAHKAMRTLLDPSKRLVWDLYFLPDSIDADAVAKVRDYFEQLNPLDLWRWKPLSGPDAIIVPEQDEESLPEEIANIEVPELRHLDASVLEVFKLEFPR